MNKRYADWLYYMKKEDEATSPSTKALYTRLKELHRDKITAMNYDHLETDEYFALTKYLDKQIKSNEKPAFSICFATFPLKVLRTYTSLYMLGFGAPKGPNRVPLRPQSMGQLRGTDPKNRF